MRFLLLAVLTFCLSPLAISKAPPECLDDAVELCADAKDDNYVTKCLNDNKKLLRAGCLNSLRTINLKMKDQAKGFMGICRGEIIAKCPKHPSGGTDLTKCLSTVTFSKDCEDALKKSGKRK